MSGERFRLVIGKTDDLRWVGHLDTVRLIIRLFRRAEHPLSYTGGFHPKPKISFAAPLPLGMSGLREVVDLTLDTERDVREIVESLRRVAPRGLDIRSLRPLEKGELAATRKLAGAELVVLSQTLPEDIEGRCESTLARAVLEVERGKRGTLDLRPSLLDLSVVQADTFAEGSVVVAQVSLGRGPSIRAEDLIDWLGLDATAQVLRTKLYCEPLPTLLE